MSAMASQITGVSTVYSTVFQAQIKENIKAPHHWPMWGESTGDRGGFPSQMASNAENVSIWWRHHVETTFNTPVDFFYNFRNILSFTPDKELLNHKL